jgi:hypothetical protein
VSRPGDNHEAERVARNKQLSAVETHYLDDVYSVEGLTRRRLEARRRWPRVAARFSELKTYCGFIGYHKSGHSLVAAMLNAHPAALIAHELDVLWLIDQGCSRQELLSMLAAREEEFSALDRRWMGYDYRIETQLDRAPLRVVGDKKGGSTTMRLFRQPELLDSLKDVVGLPVKFIHVIRDPYDNISSWIQIVDGDELAAAIPRYFRLVSAIQRLRSGEGAPEIIDVHLEEFIASPREELRRILRFLDLDVHAEHIEACAEKVFAAPRRAREAVAWAEADIAQVAERAAAIPWLDRYTASR